MVQIVGSSRLERRSFTSTVFVKHLNFIQLYAIQTQVRSIIIVPGQSEHERSRVMLGEVQHRTFELKMIMCSKLSRKFRMELMRIAPVECWEAPIDHWLNIMAGFGESFIYEYWQDFCYATKSLLIQHGNANMFEEGNYYE